MFNFFYFTFLYLITLVNAYSISIWDINLEIIKNWWSWNLDTLAWIVDLFNRYISIFILLAILFYLFPYLYSKLNKKFSFEKYENNLNLKNYWILISIFYLLWIILWITSDNSNNILWIYTIILIFFSILISQVIKWLNKNNISSKPTLYWIFIVEIIIFMFILWFYSK